MSPSPLDLKARKAESKSDEPKFVVQDITPEDAIEYLGRNDQNRALRFRVVDAYATDMINGNWKTGVGTILIADDGTIIDGQHRLHAIIQSETTQRFFVISNLPQGVRAVVDTGAKRTFADVLKLKGESRWNILSAIIRRAEIWDLGGRVMRANLQPTNSQLLKRLETNPELRDSTEVADYVRTKVPISASVIGLTHWIFTKIETKTEEETQQLKEDISAFFQKLRDGDELAKDSPISVLRRTAIENRNSRRVRVQEEVMVAYVIKAWNAYREGRKIHMLRYRPGGANPEAMPEPV